MSFDLFVCDCFVCLFDWMRSLDRESVGQGVERGDS